VNNSENTKNNQAGLVGSKDLQSFSTCNNSTDLSLEHIISFTFPKVKMNCKKLNKFKFRIPGLSEISPMLKQETKEV
jgi:hypothetical protein